jgi:hypothetical protein
MAQNPRSSGAATTWLRPFVEECPCAKLPASSALAFRQFSAGFSELASTTWMLWTGPTNQEGPVRRPIELPASWRSEC